MRWAYSRSKGTAVDSDALPEEVVEIRLEIPWHLVWDVEGRAAESGGNLAANLVMLNFYEMDEPDRSDSTSTTANKVNKRGTRGIGKRIEIEPGVILCNEETTIVEKTEELREHYSVCYHFLSLLI